MNLAKVSPNGQVTVPIDIRKRLRLRSGDKALFYTNGSGECVIANASALAIEKAQKAFAGAAEELGNPTEDDIQSWVNEIRYGDDKK
jgi:AbrB family looped-hinge helix DNA binding protein